MVINGFPWLSVVIHGYLWLSVVVCGYLRLTQEYYFLGKNFSESSITTIYIVSYFEFLAGSLHFSQCHSGNLSALCLVNPTHLQR